MSTELITDVIDIPALIGYVREVADGGLPFSGIFPAVGVEDIEYELTRVDAIVGHVARYRSWDTAPALRKRPGVTVVTGEIPPLGLSFRLNEKDIIKWERLRQKIADRYDRQVEQVIFDDAGNAAKAIQNRITLAHGELLTLGKVKLTDLGDPVSGSELVADFAPPGGHFVTAGTLWSDTTNAVPITNLKAWETTYRSNNAGENPDAWLISSTQAAELAANAQVRNLAQGNGVTPSLVNFDTVQQVCKIAGVKADLIVSDVERPNIAESATARVIADRKVCAIKSGMGATLYGTTANAMKLAGKAQLAMSDTPGIVAFVEESLRPAAVITTAEAVALPVLRDPNKVFCATV